MSTLPIRCHDPGIHLIDGIPVLFTERKNVTEELCGGILSNDLCYGMSMAFEELAH